ncbi:RagB/SusD family nutrient uptake outer membrane protein [Paraflavitalea speifideaquila]|uniref:RagB/SusD family nutrient uptake outer membrane protein n=1 Tax=Paraflavitalea speifideaquila TaxID=3076558 RepID=UPI0028EF8699|nr:RagB/SusD family nutrient uptake outer membrane protein [Paraflavitalea speifideiaquila]
MVVDIQLQGRERIRHERRIELAFEGQRFWDIRRWRIGGLPASTDAYGMEITKTGTTFKFEKFLLEKRAYQPHPDEQILHQVIGQVAVIGFLKGSL